MALSYINNKEIKFGSAKPLNGVYTPGSPTREYEPLDSLGIYLNSGIPLSYGVENGRYMSMSDEFAATSQGNSYSFNQFFAAQMMLGFKLYDRFIACDTGHKIIGTEPLLHKAYLAEITEKTLDYFKIKIYEEKTRTFCIRMSSSEVPTSYVDLTNSFDENGLNLTQTDRQSFLSYYRFYPLTARDPSSRAEETLGVDYYLLPSAEGLKELSGDILSKFNAFISSDGTLTSLGNTAFAYAGDIGYVPNYRGETSEAAVSAAESAKVILGQVEEMHADINQILPEMEENLELTKQYRDEAMSTEIGTVREDLNRLEGDSANSKKAIVELEDKKITKFYASNNGNTNLPDSDSGKPTDMKIFGKSVQNGTPSPSNPVEIQSVVNPKLSVCGKNFVNKSLFDKNYLYSQEYGGYKGQIGYQYLNFSKFYNISLLEDGVVYKFIIDIKNPSVNGTDFFSLYVKYEDGTRQTTKSIALKDVFVHLELVTNGKKISEIYVNYGLGGEIIFKEMPRLIRADEERSASLPYTLSAIPVTSGGNVTIDGQQYIADYVDVERRKLVRMVGEVDLGTLSWRFNIYATGTWSTNDIITSLNIITEKFIIADWGNITNGQFSYNTDVNALIINNGGNTEIPSGKMIYELATPTETDLADEEIEAFKALVTYYPATNVFVTSDQVDGATIFNYPLNMANGWNYVMEQIGETRPIIYDTEVKVLENSIDTAILTAMMEA